MVDPPPTVAQPRPQGRPGGRVDRGEEPEADWTTPGQFHPSIVGVAALVDDLAAEDAHEERRADPQVFDDVGNPR
jgi:hypothetical protein